MESGHPADDKMRSSEALVKGTNVSRFAIIERVCICDECEVYIAEDTDLGRKVALSFLPLKNSSNDDTIAMFTSEIQAIASLNHSNIIRIYELGDHEGRPFATSELLHGQTVRDIILNEAYSLRQFLDVAIQMCRGLSAAHEAGIVLHDLRPGSILIDAEGRVRLLGFRWIGSACVIPTEHSDSEPEITSYMSAEQLQGTQVDYLDNIFSLGLIMHEILTGRHPLRRESETETLHAKANEARTPLANHNEYLSSGLQPIIERAMDKNRETRYQHVSDLLADLERERSALEIRESEGRFRDLADLLPQTVFELDMKANFTYTNRYGYESTGYAQKDLARGINALDMFVPEDRGRAGINISKIFNGEELEAHEYTVLRKDGSSYPVLIYARPIVREGEPEGLRGIVVDISNLKETEKALQKAHDELERRIEERTAKLMEANKKLTEQMEYLRRTEEALRQSEEKYRRVFEDTVIGLYRTTPAGQILMVNPALVNMLGYSSPDELLSRDLGNSAYEPTYPRSRFIDLIESQGKVVGLESAWVKADGSILYIQESARAIRDMDGKTLHYEGTVEDITQRRQAEAALRESEEQYRLLVDNAGYPVTLFSTDGEILLINSTGARNLGGTPDDFVGKSMHDILPDMADLLAERNHEVVESGIGREVEDMMELPTGKRWFWSNLQPARDANGTIVGIQIISHDITDRKYAEEDLRTTHERLNATLNALPDLLFEMDREGNILDFRAPQPGLLYRPPEEFLGKKMDEVLPKEAADTINASLEKARELGRDSGAVYSLGIGEEVCWFEFSVAASGAPEDPNVRFVALVRNITERKRRQDELKKKTSELREEQNRLRDKNIALRQVLEQIESSRQEYQLQLYKDVDTALAPLLRKLREEAGSDRKKEFEELEAALNSILAKDIDEFKIRYGKLTSRESEICGMIKNGKTSKQISDDLNLSLLTVLKHREQIRKKLGITNKDISLVTYLRMH